MAQVINVPVNEFEPHAHRYKCCCGCIHAKTGAITIGIIEVVALIINLIGYAAKDATSQSIAGTVIGFVVTLVVVAMMIYGCIYDRPGFILPHLVLQTIGIILMAVGAVALIILGAVGSPYVAHILNVQDLQSDQNPSDNPSVVSGVVLGVLIMAVILLVIGWALEVWFILVVLTAYRYTRDAHKAAAYSGQGHQGHTNYAYPGYTYEHQAPPMYYPPPKPAGHY